MFQGTGALAFNATFYLQNNPDVFTAIQNGTFQGSALDHFVQFGQFEGRDPNQFFDTEYYLAENTDVLTAIADPANPSVTSAFQHFVMFGADEGVVRAPSAAFASFNAETYFAQNPDLQAAFGNLTGEAREDALFAHFVEFGVNESRPGSGVVVPDQGGFPGQTVALTTGVDALTGTGGNDTFVGTITGNAAQTLNFGDSINGGAGTDTLRVLASVSNDLALAPTLTNVERVEVQNAAGVTTNLSLANSTGVQTLASVNSAGTTAFTGVSAAAAIALSNTTGDVSVTYAAGLASPASGQNIALNNVDGSTVTVNNATTFNIAATGENSVDGLVSGKDVTTLNISGAGSLEIVGAVDATVTTVNASANTGGVDIDVSAATKDLTVTGGSGDDRFVFGELGAKDVVNGGAGFDTVVVDAGNFSAPGAAAPFNALTGIERVEFEDTGDVTLQGNTFTNASITNLLFNNDGNATILNAGSARTYEYGSDFTGDTTLQLKSAATTLNVDLLGDEGSAATGADIGTLTVAYAAGTAATAVTTLNIDSLGDLTTGSNTIDSISIRNGSTIVITGDADLDIGGLVATVPAAPATGALGSGLGFTIDASGFEAELTIASGADGDDFILASTGDTTIELDGGTSGDFVAAGVGPADIVNFDVVTGFTAGADGDVLDFVGADSTFTATTEATQTTITNTATTLAEAFEIATSTSTGWTAFEFGGEVYAAHNDGTAGFSSTADVVVQLVGVDVADLVGGVQGNFA